MSNEPGETRSRTGDVSGSAAGGGVTGRGTGQGSVNKVLVLYNCDYDPTPKKRGIAGRDRSEVARAAHDVTDAIAAHGLEAGILGIHGHDIGAILDKLKKLQPDLIFNLTESLAQDSTNEIV